MPIRAAILPFLFLLSGCAELQFTDHQPVNAVNNQPEEGYVHFQEQSVYLSVNYALLSDGASCGYVGQFFLMNDPSKNHYVRPKAGYGSNNLSASFSNGILTSFGQQTDTTKAVGDAATIAGLVGAGPVGGAAAATLTTKVSGTPSARSARTYGFNPSKTMEHTTTSTIPPTKCKEGRGKLFRFNGAAFEPIATDGLIDTQGKPITVDQFVAPAASGAADTPKSTPPKQ